MDLLKTYAANFSFSRQETGKVVWVLSFDYFFAHHSRVRKRVKLSGSCLLTTFYVHHSRVRKQVKLSGSCLLTTFYAHHSRVRKRVKVSGSCLSTFYGFR